MGTITRAFANNITTSGVFTSSAFNNDSFDNVTAVPSGSVITDDMVLVSSATASSSASIEFTLGDYKEYKFFFVNIHPQNNSVVFNFNLSTDNGSNYNVVKTSSSFNVGHYENDGATSLAYNPFLDLAQGTGDQVISAAIGNGNDECVSGILQLFNPSSSTFVKHYLCTSNTYQVTPASYESFIGGYANTVSPITNIRFNINSGNIDAGKILMFGVN